MHTPTLWLLFAPLLIMIGLLIVLLALQANTVAGSSSRAGTNIALLVIDFVIILVIIPITFYWFFKFSKAVGQYTSGAVNTAVAFLLLYLLRFIGIAVIQDHFNDMLEGKAMLGSPAAAASYPQPSAAGPSDFSAAAAAPVINPAPVQPSAPAEAAADSDESQNPTGPTPPVSPIG